jgi:hypothetical protein
MDEDAKSNHERVSGEDQGPVEVNPGGGSGVSTRPRHDRTMTNKSALFALLYLAAPVRVAGQEPLFVAAASSPIHVGEGSGTILFGDLNRDTRQDLLTRHLLTKRIELLRGDGKGGFTPFGPSLEFAYEPGDMELGYVNRDRILDLVVTAGSNDIVDVFLGDGRGGFRPVPGSPFTLSRVADTYNKRSLHLVDLNSDGNLDIATANGRLRNTVRTLLGDGQGGFRPGPMIQLDSRGDGFVLAFADVDGDRKLDVVTASRPEENSGRLAIQLGDGGGGFRTMPGSAMRIASQPSAIAIDDVDRDGRSDIIIGHSTGKVTFLLHRGQGIYEPAAGSPLEIGSPLFAMLVLDVNGDKLVDLAIPTVNHVTVLLGGPAGFTAAQGSPYPAGPGAYYLGAGDANGDGKVDLAASSFEGTGLVLLLGR